MKQIKTEDAVGAVLCHDITEIVRGVRKGARFRKGHIVREEDIPVLLSLGKENLYVWENDETMMHENEAAEALSSAFKNCTISAWRDSLTPLKDSVSRWNNLTTILKSAVCCRSAFDVVSATLSNLVLLAASISSCFAIWLMIDSFKLNSADCYMNFY